MDELKATAAQVRGEILKSVGITPEISAGEGLAMTAELALPWKKLRYTTPQCDPSPVATCRWHQW